MYRISFILRLEGGGDNLGAGVTENQRWVDVTSCDRTIHDSERDIEVLSSPTLLKFFERPFIMNVK